MATKPETVDLGAIPTVAALHEDQSEHLSRGDNVGRYVVLELIGEGGMGVVYRAFDPELDRSIALKVLRAREDGEGGSGRIYREAQAMARLAHPNVVTIYDVGRASGRVFIAMELVEGETLSGWLAEHGRETDEVLDAFVRAGRGLAAAHVAGLVHRDFKPDNVLVGRDGRIRVTDFGLARGETEISTQGRSGTPLSRLEFASGASERSGGLLSSPLTRTGAILGTPAYMAPEQFRGLSVGPHTDQFSFCVALYEALYGQRPFVGEKPGAVALSVTTGERRTLQRPASVQLRVAAAIDRGLATDPNERWPAMESLLAELQPEPPVRRWPVAVGGVVAMVAAATAVIATRGEESPCRGSAERLAEVWSPARAKDVQSAFTRVDVPMAPAMAGRATKALDGYGERWVAAQVEACEATRVRGDQSDELLDLSTACLQRRLEEVEAAVVVLERANAEVVANSLDVVAHIEPVDRCLDAKHLRADVPLPADPDTRLRIEAVRAHVDRSNMLAAAGRPEGAAREAEAAVELAKLIDYLPVRAAATLRYGTALAQLADYEPARETLLQAWWYAIEGEADELAFQAAVGLAIADADVNARLQWIEHAKAFAQRTSASVLSRAELQMAEAGVHGGMDDYHTAAELYAELTISLHGVGGGAEVIVTTATLRLATMQKLTGRPDLALETYERARALATDTYGMHHPVFAEIDGGIATALLLKGETARALEHARRACRSTQAAFGSHSSITARAETELAMVLHRHGEFEESQQWYARAAIMLEESDGQSEGLATLLANWGATLDELGRFEEAVATHRRALVVAESLAAPTPTVRAIIHDNLGSALQGVGAFEEALSHHRVALPLWAEMSTTDIHYGIALRDQARALIGLGRESEARALLETAMEVFVAGGFDPLELELTRFHLGRALHADPGDREQGLQLVEAARVWFGNAGPRAQEQLADAEAWLDENTP